MCPFFFTWKGLRVRIDAHTCLPDSRQKAASTSYMYTNMCVYILYIYNIIYICGYYIFLTINIMPKVHVYCNNTGDHAGM